MGTNILKGKTYAFAIGIVKLCQALQEKREYILSKQILRSGTAVGALVREAEFGESRDDFSHKLSIALKEANETFYWLLLLRDTGYIENTPTYRVLYLQCDELIAILTSIVRKTKKRQYAKT